MRAVSGPTTPAGCGRQCDSPISSPTRPIVEAIWSRSWLTESRFPLAVTAWWSGASDPGHTTAAVPKECQIFLGRWGSWCTWADSEGNPVGHGGTRCWSSARHRPLGRDGPGDGTTSATSPTAPATYTIDIRSNGVAISGSPFTVRVGGSAEDADRLTVSFARGNLLPRPPCGELVDTLS